MIDSYTFADYVSNNYLTLLILASLIILLIVNRGAKISGLNYIRSIIGIVFALTLDFLGNSKLRTFVSMM